MDEDSMRRSSDRSTRTTRIIRAAPETLYAAFIDAAALLDWLPPPGMTSRMHAFDARVGGGYEMSLYYPPDEQRFNGKSAAGEDRIRVRFLELVPPRRIVESVWFVTDDPAYSGEMTLTVTIEPVPDGSAVTMAFDGLPPGLKAEDNDAGARTSLEQLARRYE
jgi:uncharacterized protein YndB with AHSA1/START domain